MERRDLIKALLASPLALTPIGGKEAAIAKIEKGQHVMFFDEEFMDIRMFEDFPIEGMVFIAVDLHGRNIDDVLRIYKLD